VILTRINDHILSVIGITWH